MNRLVNEDVQTPKTGETNTPQHFNEYASYRIGCLQFTWTIGCLIENEQTNTPNTAVIKRFHNGL